MNNLIKNDPNQPIMIEFTKNELKKMLNKIPTNNENAAKNKKKIQSGFSKFEHFVGVMANIDSMNQLVILDVLAKKYKVVEPIIGFKDLQIYGVVR